jgi:hypothetical protein
VVYCKPSRGGSHAHCWVAGHGSPAHWFRIGSCLLKIVQKVDFMLYSVLPCLLQNLMCEIRRFGLALCLCLSLVSCQQLGPLNQTRCEPTTYYEIQNPVVLESFVLVTCVDGKTHDIVPQDSLVVVPSGGKHALYVRTKSGWELPSFLSKNVQSPSMVYAGGCPIDLGCIPEFDSNGFPADSNYVDSIISIIDPHTLRIEFKLPNEPRQVSIRLNICDIWADDDYCLPPKDDFEVGVEFGYVFRYETINHIEELQPGTECRCHQ